MRQVLQDIDKASNIKEQINRDYKDSLFKEALTKLLNHHKKDAEAKTPDWILSEYLIRCLDAYIYAQNKTATWLDEVVTATIKEEDKTDIYVRK